VPEIVTLEVEPPESEVAAAAITGRASTITGTIRRCGRAAAGIRVTASEELTLGVETRWKPCLKTTSMRQLGSARTGADGTYELTYAPPPDAKDFCAYSARVFVEASDGIITRRSPRRIERPSLHVDLELYPGCQAGSTPVVVLERSGRGAADAEVFVNGVSRGRTDEQGVLALPSLERGDTLAARLLLAEHRTGRRSHDADSTQNWSHRTYSTTVHLHHDGQGNEVRLPQTVVADPDETQELRLSTSNTLIGLNLVASIEWDATAEEFGRYADRLKEMSELLYNESDGQMLVERLTIADDGRLWDDADIRIHASLNEASHASVGALFSSSGHIEMNPNDMHEPSVTLHELGHFAFGVYDEYKPGADWKPSDGPHYCTFASGERGTPFGQGGSKDSCIMRGARKSEVKKICSMHPDNPHAPTTAQGLRDCWSTILSRFGDAHWLLLEPAGRGAIIDELPDSGVPLATGSEPPPGVGPVRSYIPLAAWKPALDTRNVAHPNECPNQLVRVELDGAPHDNARVSLVSGSRTILEGVTKPYALWYGETNGHGEVRLRGAHVGDRVIALAAAGASIAHGAATIEACRPDPLVVSLVRSPFGFRPLIVPVAPDELQVAVDAEEDAGSADVRIHVEGLARPLSAAVPQARDPALASLRAQLSGLPTAGRLDLEVVALDPEGEEISLQRSVAFASARDEVPLRARSADGRLELALAARALPLPVQLVIETLGPPVPEAPEGSRFLSDAYRIASSQGEELSLPSPLGLELDVDPDGKLRTGEELLRPLLVRLAGSEHWEPLADQNRSMRHVGAHTDRLGTFAVLDRT
jgi:hypothetical protein